MRRGSLIVLVSLTLAACGGGASGDGATGDLSDLTSVDELRTQFNQDRGEPRLLLLLSPT